MKMKDGFAPVVGINPRMLILGSLPGEPSLRANQYYANKQNAFWHIMGRLLNFSPNLSYADRIYALKQAGVALWDVLNSAQRVGSLDSAIEDSSANVNDIASFLKEFPSIHAIFLNGKKAACLFDRLVSPQLSQYDSILEIATLPSTSPANTHLTRDGKLQAWKVVSVALTET